MSQVSEYGIRISADDKQFRETMTRTRAGLESINKTASAVTGGMSAITSEVGRLSPALSGLTNTVSGVMGGFMALGPSGAVVAAIGAGVGLCATYFSKLSEDANREAKVVADAYLSAVRSAAEAIGELANLGASAGAVKREENLNEQVKLNEEITRLEKEYADEKERARSLDDPQYLDSVYKRYESILGTKRATLAEMEREGLAIRQQRDDQERIAQAAKNAADAAARGAAKGAGVAKALKEAADATKKAAKEAADALEKLPDDTDKSMGLVFQGLVAAREARQADLAGIYNTAQLRHDLAARENELVLERREQERQHHIKMRDLRIRNEEALRDIAKDSANDVARTINDAMLSAGASTLTYYGELYGAILAGDEERVSKMKRDNDLMLWSMAEGIASKLAAEAIGQGSILMMRGTAEGLLGNMGGWGAAAVGAALVVAGAAGTFGAGVLGGYVSSEGARRSALDSKSKERGTTSAPTVTGPGTSGGSETTIINYYFGGPVFGNPDDAARTVAAMNERGQTLRGGRRG